MEPQPPTSVSRWYDLLMAYRIRKSLFASPQLASNTCTMLHRNLMWACTLKPTDTAQSCSAMQPSPPFQQHRGIPCHVHIQQQSAAKRGHCILARPCGLDQPNSRRRLVGLATCRSHLDAETNVLCRMECSLHRFAFTSRKSQGTISNSIFKVADRTLFVPINADTELAQPADLQSKINQQIKNFSQGRAFVRPSGTEDVVRVYAEAATHQETQQLSAIICGLVFDQYGGVGQRPAHFSP